MASERWAHGHRWPCPGFYDGNQPLPAKDCICHKRAEATPTLAQHLGHANVALIASGMPEEEAFAITARVLDAHDAEVKAEALEEAADDALVLGVVSGSLVKVGERAATWLRTRAAAIRAGE